MDIVSIPCSIYKVPVKSVVTLGECPTHHQLRNEGSSQCFQGLRLRLIKNPYSILSFYGKLLFSSEGREDKLTQHENGSNLYTSSKKVLGI